MTNNENDKQLVWEQCRDVLLVASEQALIETIEAIASQVGVAQIQGSPVRESFERLKREKTERLIADFADTNPRLASEVKAALDELDREREDQPDT